MSSLIIGRFDLVAFVYPDIFISTTYILFYAKGIENQHRVFLAYAAASVWGRGGVSTPLWGDHSKDLEFLL